MHCLLRTINRQHHVTVMAKKKEALIAGTVFAFLIRHLAETCTDSWHLSVSRGRCMLNVQFSYRLLQFFKTWID